MNRKQKIIVSITGITIVLLALVGLTYAYFLTRITGNTKDKSISVTTANLELLYGDGNGILLPAGLIQPSNENIKFYISNEETEDPTDVLTDENGEPLVQEAKTFTVTNNGDGEVKFAITLEKLNITYASDGTIIAEDGTEIEVLGGQETSFKYPNDFKIHLDCSVTEGSGNCLDGDAVLQNKENDILLIDRIQPNETYTYDLTMIYQNTDYDQSDDMNKSFEARVNIADASDTVDITGEVDEALLTEALYVQTNSVKRTSRVNSDGTYKIVGLEIGDHTLKLCKASDTECTTPLITETLSIVKGKTSGVSGKTLTITDKSRTANINISSTAVTISETISDYVPYKGILIKDVVEVGDYVNYTYLNSGETSRTYTTPTVDSGKSVHTTTQTFNSAVNGSVYIPRWIVVEIGENDITLIGELPSSVTSDNGLILSGANGWTNGSTILKEMAETLYSGQYGTATVISEPDLKRLMGYSYNPFFKDNDGTRTNLYTPVTTSSYNTLELPEGQDVSIQDLENMGYGPFTARTGPNGITMDKLFVNYHIKNAKDYKKASKMDQNVWNALYNGCNSTEAPYWIDYQTIDADFSKDSIVYRQGFVSFNMETLKGGPSARYLYSVSYGDVDNSDTPYFVRPMVKISKNLYVSENKIDNAWELIG